MSLSFHEEQERARARMRAWHRSRRFQYRMRVYAAIAGLVGLVTFLLVLAGQLR